MTKSTQRMREFWTVRNRLILGYAIEVMITILLGTYALTRLRVINADSRRLVHDALPGISIVNQIDSQVGKVYGLTLKSVLSTNAPEAEAQLSAIRAELETLNQLVGELQQLANTPQETSSLESISTVRTSYAAASVNVLGLPPGHFHEKLEVVTRELDPAYRRFQDAIKVAVELKRASGESAGAQIQTAVSSAEAGIMAGICASVFLVLTSGYFLIRAITTPLLRLTAAMENVRLGDFTERLTADRRDEFGELASGFNHMADSLSDLVSRVQRSGLLVDTAAAQLASGARQQESGAQEAAATTVEIGATAKEISTTSQDLVKTVKDVAQVAEQTTAMAGNGQAGLQRMQETMVQVMGAASTISGKLTVLNEKAGSISQVVTTIAKVADQTNLLSLNAAIEAEKAGEYGRGFAVVATEIRRLADQTAVASHDIEQTVKEMQTAVSAGVMSVDKFSEEVRRGVQEVNQVGGQLNEIIRQVQALTPQFESVSEGMQMHAVGAQQISAALVQLGGATQHTVESLRQSTAIIERLNQAMDTLRGAVSRFKLQPTSAPAPADLDGFLPDPPRGEGASASPFPGGPGRLVDA
jgi:methyl-accepting chemotaxis protein WspA